MKKCIDNLFKKEPMLVFVFYYLLILIMSELIVYFSHDAPHPSAHSIITMAFAVTWLKFKRDEVNKNG